MEKTTNDERTTESNSWSDLTVGSTVWLYEEDERRLRMKPSHLAMSRNHQYKNHWQQHAIEGETRLSWLVAGKKIPKRGRPDYPLVLISEREVDETAYVRASKRDLARTIESLRDHPDNARPLELLVRALANMGVTIKTRSD